MQSTLDFADCAEKADQKLTTSPSGHVPPPHAGKSVHQPGCRSSQFPLVCLFRRVWRCLQPGGLGLSLDSSRKERLVVKSLDDRAQVRHGPNNFAMPGKGDPGAVPGLGLCSLSGLGSEPTPADGIAPAGQRCRLPVPQTGAAVVRDSLLDGLPVGTSRPDQVSQPGLPV